jgi:hypothetical protein
MFRVSKARLIRAALLLGGAIAMTYLLYAVDPSRSTPYPFCPFYALTGLYCPGCGSLRALHSLLHGQVMAAFGFNSFMLLSLPYVLYCFLSYATGTVRRKPSPAFFVPANIIWLFLGCVVIFSVLRNIPQPPWSWLAP